MNEKHINKSPIFCKSDSTKSPLPCGGGLGVGKIGYKQTNIGIIPQDWEVVRLGEVGDIVGGGTPDTTNPAFWNGEILWLTPTEIKQKYISTSERKITQKGLENSSAKILPKNTILITTRATIGDIGIATKQLCTNQGFQSFVSGKNANFEFMYYLLCTKRSQFISLANGSTFLEVSAKTMRQIQIPLPPLKEQEKIARILGVWDSAIDSLANLIKAKRKYKTTLMQRLLTPPRYTTSCHTEGVARSIQKDDLQGNDICLDSSLSTKAQNDKENTHNDKKKIRESSLRFAGFTDKWQEFRLGEVCKITTGSLNANAMVENGKFAFFTCAKEVYAIDNYAFDTEALLISGNGANVGYIHYYNGRFNAYQRTYVLDNFVCDILFVKFFLDRFLKKRISQEKNEGNTPYIVLSTLQDMKIQMPNSLAEQKKIAQVLSACDKEIETLNLKFECLKAQKMGLMQQLLSGKVRVKC